MTPAILGDLAFQIRCVPAATATGSFINIAAGTDTGTVVASGRTVDLSWPLGYSNTGGKPLDATINPTSREPRRYNSLAIAVPLELTFHSSGKFVIVTVGHYHRSATAGAGSTWALVQTADTKKFKAGTDTDTVYQHGFVSSIPTQAVKRYYKAVVTIRRRKATSTAAQDTTTDTSIMSNAPLYLFGGVAKNPAQD